MTTGDRDATGIVDGSTLTDLEGVITGAGQGRIRGPLERSSAGGR